MASEFDLIRRHFTRPVDQARLGVGDDCALIDVTPGQTLAVSTDMLVAGTHFLPGDVPRFLGRKTLAVNLSDLAAMGARPRFATLSLSLPEADEAWLADFSRGFFEQAGEFGVELVGGDTTRGPLNLCVTVFGEVPADLALRRAGARAGDDVWVSGTLGEAALGLAHKQGRTRLPDALAATCLARLHDPAPRVALGLGLRGLAHAAIDVSDGLLADLGHILESSGLGAEIRLDALPVNPALSLADPLVRRCALAGGDDYELVFTADPENREKLAEAARQAGVAITHIGHVTAGEGLVVKYATGQPVSIGEKGFDHFV